MGTKDNTYANTGKRLYFLSDDVDNESIGQLTWNILHQLAEDDEKDKKEKDYKREPIKIYINSYGGVVYDMWGLIEIIVNSLKSNRINSSNLSSHLDYQVELMNYERIDDEFFLYQS